MTGLAAPTLAQPVEQMDPPQLLRALQRNISSLKETETVLRHNSEASAKNIARTAALRNEGAALDLRTGDYDEEAANHNRQAAAYRSKCQGGKLEEDIYEQCLTLKQNLDIQKARLDASADQIEADHAVYNQKVIALNDEEAARAEAAIRLTLQYQAEDQAIRDIQLRLYDLSTGSGREGFSEAVRQCTKRATLDDMYSCMTSVWGN